MWGLNGVCVTISIHALREEGDQLGCISQSLAVEFLSTPSARRATGDAEKGRHGIDYFYPRPPRGGRLRLHLPPCFRAVISIHALREEGDSVA